MKDNKTITIKDMKNLFSVRRPGTIGKHKIFSVLVPLVEIDGELNLLYEVRAENLKRQPGQICFPGGELEPGESYRDCAVRETVEELNVPKEKIELIGQLDTLHSYENFSMYCYIGKIDYEVIKENSFSTDEVKEIFFVPLEFFLTTEPYIYELEIIPDVKEDFPYDMIKFNNGYNWRRGNSDVPIYDYEGKIIWGLTGRITRNLAEIIKQEFRDL